MRRSRFMLALFTLVIVTAACGKAKDSGFPPIPTGTATEVPCERDASTDPVEVGADPILIGDNWYTPLNGAVKVGADIHWEQCGVAPHTVTFSELEIDSSPACPGDTSKCTAAGDTFMTKLTKAGTYHYYCKLHGAKGSTTGMYGVITAS